MPLHARMSALFSPASIVVAGVSRHTEKLGHIVLQNLLRGGYTGKIFPINPHVPQGGTILGLPVLRKASEIPCRPLDLGIICLPADQVPDCLEDLAALSLSAAIVIGAGFGEVGGRGVKLEEQIRELAKARGIALLGPASMGLAHARGRLNATFASGALPLGDIGFFSQSGALSAALFDWARAREVGFSSFVSLGNRAVLDESDFLNFLADDPDTKVILGYLEGVANGPRFLQSAQAATRKKPVILLKAGRTAAGGRAASSHTGALAGSDSAYDAAFRQTGVIRVRRMEDLFGMAQAFAGQPLPQGPGLAVVTNAGGAGIVATDACELAGLSPAALSLETLAALKEILPSYASIYNPVDVGGGATAQRMAAAVDVALGDSAVHSLLIVASPTAPVPLEQLMDAVAEKTAGHAKPVFACLMGGEGVAAARRVCAARRIPCYAFPEPAVDAVAAMYRQSRWRESPLPVEVGYRHDTTRVRKIIDEAAGAVELAEYQAQGILRAYELPMLEAKLARTSDEAVKIARQMGCPVALKIASPQIPHKTEVKGVALGLDTPEKIRAAFLEITGQAIRLRKGAYIAGCLVQAMAPAGSREVIISFRRDSCFGPLISFSLGGIHAESFKDLSCRLAPLSLDDAHDMVREIRAFPLLAGLSGEPPVKFTAIEDILLIMSQLALDFPEIQEAECNPVLVNGAGALVGSIRLVLAQGSRKA